MKYLFIAVSILVLNFSFGGVNPVDAEELTYQNPLGNIKDIGDPFIMKTDSGYYMYATSAPNYGFKAWHSDNLVVWRDMGLVYDNRRQEHPWGTGDFWAPEVIEHNGEFYMTFSARTESGSLRIAIAKSESEIGPFIDLNADLVNEAGSYIDGHILEDEGTFYFYYVKDVHENVINSRRLSQILVQEMSEGLDYLVGRPQLVLTPDQDWEHPLRQEAWNEGPFVLKHDNKYYLMYSANMFADPDYGVGYAVSDHPIGPFVKYENNPILQKDLEIGVSGPGHNSVTKGLDDETLYMVYHIHTDPNHPSGNRQMSIDHLYFENGVLKLDGPTMSEQKLY
ncbi:glycoside hydrolase family 43 protein [Fundicoccus culcitae]|uniref:Glycoside hydrolase family 43 protein n=1 Tax=Fundicoccus culcitae TaxID=2969821 RepID=A0ABY5PAC0_9LACT|nr:glycoside hydrolase family 43 protein [Fundicoccus culcitae]UUX35385.1 glycoside hydrolase family 43 protein [Fundicoccus culcitae]